MPLSRWSADVYSGNEGSTQRASQVWRSRGRGSQLPQESDVSRLSWSRGGAIGLTGRIKYRWWTGMILSRSLPRETRTLAMHPNSTVAPSSSDCRGDSQSGCLFFHRTSWLHLLAVEGARRLLSRTLQAAPYEAGLTMPRCASDNLCRRRFSSHHSELYQSSSAPSFRPSSSRRGSRSLARLDAFSRFSARSSWR
jgi:hypothetical protein